MNHLLARLAAALLVLALLAGCADTVIHEGDSPYGKLFVTESNDGLRTLLFDLNGGRQSVARTDDPEHLELAYSRSALVGLAFTPSPRRVLVVGLGGGTLPRLLHRHYPEAIIDVAEINPGVVDVAKRYFGLAPDERLRVHLGDGRAFVEAAAPSSYDFVLLDAFAGNTVPTHLTTREFLGAVRRVLSAQGVVVSNVWNRSANRVYDDMIATYQQVFPQVSALDVPATVNVIVLARPQGEAVSREALAARAAKLRDEQRFRYDLAGLVMQGWIAPERLRAGRVLSDADRR